MSRTPEGIEKDKVKAFLKSIGAYQFWPVPAGYGRQGIDCFACVKGRFWAIEVKATEKEEPTARQKQTLDEVFATGGMIVSGTGETVISTINYVLRHIK